MVSAELASGVGGVEQGPEHQCHHADHQGGGRERDPVRAHGWNGRATGAGPASGKRLQTIRNEARDFSGGPRPADYRRDRTPGSVAQPTAPRRRRPVRRCARPLDLLADRPVLALTGAGMSTDSGIPDYRGPGAPARTPMTYAEFVSGPEAQRRYWARSHVGWSRMGTAQPQRRPPRRSPRLEADGRVAAADHPERRRPARGRRVARGCARCTAGSPTWSAWAAATHAEPRRARRAGSTSSTPAGSPGTATSPTGPTATSALDETDGFVVPPCDRVRRGAQAGRGVLRRERARSPGCSAATPRSTRSRRSAARCWCSARR